MKTTINLSKDDRCQACEKKICPENVYDCPQLTEMINNKQARYIWLWVKKE